MAIHPPELEKVCMEVRRIHFHFFEAVGHFFRCFFLETFFFLRNEIPDGESQKSGRFFCENFESKSAAFRF